MSRPKPRILTEAIGSDSTRIDQVLETEALWAVFYQGKPFNLKSCTFYTDETQDSKYKKIAFSNPGHALGLAKKLNEQFQCNDFAVYKLTSGEKIDIKTGTLG
jgi:hypothetical protein